MSDFVLVPVLLWPVLTLFLIWLISSICFEIFKLILWFSARALIVSCRARRNLTEFTTIINPSQERLILNPQNIIVNSYHTGHTVVLFNVNFQVRYLRGFCFVPDRSVLVRGSVSKLYYFSMSTIIHYII